MGFWRMRWVPRLVAVGRGAWSWLQGVRWPMAWCGRAVLVVLLILGQDGAQVRTPRGSASGPVGLEYNDRGGDLLLLAAGRGRQAAIWYSCVSPVGLEY